MATKISVSKQKFGKNKVSDPALFRGYEKRENRPNRLLQMLTAEINTSQKVCFLTKNFGFSRKK